MRILLFALCSALSAADKAPSWVRDAAAMKTGAYPSQVAVAVLLQEEQVTVDPDGRRVMRERGVKRILQRSRDSVRAFRSYNSKSGRIRDFQGWVIPPSGEAVELSRKGIIDVALATDSTYDEYRGKVLDAGNSLEPGSTFAYEVTEEERTVFTQYPYAFQESAPVLVSRFVVTVPAGWEVKGEMLNAPRLEPAVAGGTYTWELRDLPWREPEEYAPDTHVLAPRLGVTYYPPEGSGARLPRLANWSTVSGWLAGLVDPPATVSEAIRAKAAQLTAGASTELEKLRAIAAFAQQTTYVSIQMNLTRGGGYTPNPADQILARNYGDCKDKATLVRALLAGAGMESFATAIYWGDRQLVRAEWPSPHPFNHMIVAVKVSGETRLPVVFEHARLGRLLPFDPTDPYTPLGDLPREQQGSRALIVAGAQGELATMPLLAPSANRIESVTEARYEMDGALAATVKRQYYGQAAARLRRLSRSQGQDEFRKSFESGLSRRLGGLTLGRIEAQDQMEQGRLDLQMEMSLKQFGQLMQERLLVITPGALAPTPEYGFTAQDRKAPIELMGSLRKDRVTLAVPAHFQLDELPDAVKVESPYGAYKAAWSYGNGVVAFVQEMEVRDVLVPAAEYTAVRRFFEQVSGAQASAVVLLKR